MAVDRHGGDLVLVYQHDAAERGEERELPLAELEAAASSLHRHRGVRFKQEEEEEEWEGGGTLARDSKGTEPHPTRRTPPSSRPNSAARGAARSGGKLGELRRRLHRRSITTGQLFSFMDADRLNAD